MTAPHTAALDHALAEALREVVVRFRISRYDTDGKALEYDVDAYFEDNPKRVYIATAETPLAALNRLMTAIRAMKANTVGGAR